MFLSTPTLIGEGLIVSAVSSSRTTSSPSTIEKRPYGTLSTSAAVDEYTLTNANQAEVKIITYGGIITSIRVPDRKGALENVVLGLSNLADYETKNPFFGCITGRYANRIAKAKFTLDGKTYSLAANNGPNALHGGTKGFDKHVWAAEVQSSKDGAALELTYLSPDGAEGFPGNLNTTVIYTLTEDNALRIDYSATTDAPTVINLTNHTLFNLAGNGAGSIENHIMLLNADHYTPVDDTLIPTGTLAPVEGTPLDFRLPKTLGPGLRSAHPQIVVGRGYDHNFVLNRPDAKEQSTILAARVYEPNKGRILEVWTSEPGIQLYTANFLDGTLFGSSGGLYRQGDGFALETQHFPDSPNQPNFPSTVLRPGEIYRTTTLFKFRVG
jgi:aldose 1-epimerase